MVKRYVFLLLLMVVSFSMAHGEETVLSLTNFKIMGLPSIEVVDSTTHSILQSSTPEYSPYLCFSTDCPEDTISIYVDGEPLDVQLFNYKYVAGLYCLYYSLFYSDHKSGLTVPAKEITLECNGINDSFYYYVNINTNKEFALKIPKKFLSNQNINPESMIYLSLPPGKEFHFILSSQDTSTGEVIPSSTIDLQADAYDAYMLNPLTLNAKSEELSDLSGYNISFVLPYEKMYLKSFYLSFIGKRTENCLDSPDSCWGAYYFIAPLPIIFNTEVLGLNEGEEASLNSTFAVLLNYTVIDKNAGGIKEVGVKLYGKNADGEDLGISLENKEKELYIPSSYEGTYYLITSLEHSNGNTYMSNYTFNVAPYYVVLNLSSSSSHYAGERLRLGVSLEDKEKEKVVIDSVDVVLINANGTVVNTIPFDSATLSPNGEYVFSFSLPQDASGKYYIKAIVTKAGREIVNEKSIEVRDTTNRYCIGIENAQGEEIDKGSINLSVNATNKIYLYLHNVGKPFFLSQLNIHFDKEGIKYNISEENGDGNKNLVSREDVYSLELTINPITLLNKYGSTGDINIDFSVGDFNKRVILHYTIDLQNQLLFKLSSPVVVLDQFGNGALNVILSNGLKNVSYKRVKVVLSGPLAEYFSITKKEVDELKGGETVKLSFPTHSSSTVSNTLTISLYIDGDLYKNITTEVRLDKDIKKVLERFEEVYSKFKYACDDELDQLYVVDSDSYEELSDECSTVMEEARQAREGMDKEEMNKAIVDMGEIIKEVDNALSSSTSQNQSSLTLESLSEKLEEACSAGEISEEDCDSINVSIEALKVEGNYTQADLASLNQKIEEAMQGTESSSSGGGAGKVLLLLFLIMVIIIGGVIFFTSLVPEDEQEQEEGEEEF